MPKDVLVDKLQETSWPVCALVEKSSNGSAHLKSFHVPLAKAPKLQLKVYKRVPSSGIYRVCVSRKIDLKCSSFTVGFPCLQKISEATLSCSCSERVIEASNSRAASKGSRKRTLKSGIFKGKRVFSSWSTIRSTLRCDLNYFVSFVFLSSWIWIAIFGVFGV